MYLGRFQHGNFLPLDLTVETTTGSPSLPTYAPLAKVFDNTGDLKATIKLPIKDRYGTTGYFSRSYRIPTSWGTGKQWFVVYQWIRAGNTYQKAATFELFNTGDEDGNVPAMTSLQKADAIHVVYETESGKVKSGRNPT